jgi:hypothetical protein
MSAFDPKADIGWLLKELCQALSATNLTRYWGTPLVLFFAHLTRGGVTRGLVAHDRLLSCDKSSRHRSRDEYF